MAPWSAMRSSPTARSGITGISIIQLLATWCLALALIAGLTHSYKLLAAIGAVVGVGVLVATLLILWWLQRHDRGAAPGSPDARRREQAIRVGLICGLLWVVEISVNNFLAPPLPGRDWFDDVIWAAASVLILAGAAHAAYRGRRIRIGIRFGAWSGLASGMVACAMALSIVVFGMSFLVADPLNVRRNVDPLVPGRNGIANPCEHICDRIGHSCILVTFAR